MVDLSPSQKARLIGLVTLGAIVLTLAVFWLITWLQGDPTNHLKEHQPSPAPSSAASLGP